MFCSILYASLTSTVPTARPRRVKIPKEKLLACRYGALRLGYLVKGPEVVDWLEVVDWVLAVLHRSILFYTFHRSASKPC